MSRYDLVVIGGGSGGVRAARVAASYGAKVALVEEFRLGGTCVIRGCVPKKLYKYAAEFSNLFEVAQSYGWQVSAEFDWPTLRINKEKEISRLEGIYGSLLHGSGVTTFADRAVIEDETHVRLVKEDVVVETARILIATGGRPFVPEIPGADLAITSNEAFDLPTLPQRVLVVGGGYVAVEFASIFNGLGSKVTLAYRGGQVLRGFDGHLREGLSEEMQGHGIEMCLGTQPQFIEKTAQGLRVTCNDGTISEVDQVFYATGRLPNSAGLGLESVGIKLGHRGEIPVDEFSRTSCDTIWAVGDVTDRAALTPVAIREGAAFAETEFNDNPTKVDHSIISTAVFSTPELGTVGLIEEQAGARYKEVNVYVSRFKPMLYSFKDTHTRFTIKLITDAKTDRILGVHIMGSGAAEMIQMVGIAVTAGLTKADLDRTIALHPTAAEELVTLKQPSYKLINGERE